MNEPAPQNYQKFLVKNGVILRRSAIVRGYGAQTSVVPHGSDDPVLVVAPMEPGKCARWTGSWKAEPPMSISFLSPTIWTGISGEAGREEVKEIVVPSRTAGDHNQLSTPVLRKGQSSCLSIEIFPQDAVPALGETTYCEA